MLEVLKLRNLRLKEQKNFNENNLCLYEHITSYIKATNLTSYEKEEILHKIMDMLLQAQYENRDVTLIFQLILDKMFYIDPYKYFINLNDVILIIIPIIILVLLGIAVYKKNYNLKY